MKSTQKILFASFVTVLGFVLVSNSVSSQQTAGELFERALYMEEAKGDLRKAIELYQKILKQFPENREVAAKAQLHIGLCYEKLGLKEAQKAYQKVVDNYPEQTEAVKVAKEKLSLLLRARTVIEKGYREFNIRQVWAGPEVNISGAPSPDGRYLTYVDWETGDLAIREFATGKKRRLTNKGSWFESSEYTTSSSWSPDSKQVVYNWWSKEYVFELRVVGLDGSKPRLLYRNEKVIYYIDPFDWSPDGKHILALLTRKEGTNQIVLVSVADGSVRVLKSLDWHSPVKMSFSAEGRYIVYDFPPQKDSPQRDIFLLATDGSQENILVEHPANDLYPIWVPDGKRVLFFSDRTRTLGAWVIQVINGKSEGAPELIKKDMGKIFPMGFTRKGSFYYGIGTWMNDVYIATFDPKTGKVLAPPKKATQRFIGSNVAPEWSPDGQYLAYISYRGPDPYVPSSEVIAIRSLKTGEERELSPELTSFFHRFRWSPDGRFILVQGSNKKNQGIYRIDVQTSDFSPIVVQSEPGTSIRDPWLSPDGKTIFYKRIEWSKKLSQILSQDLETGQEKELYRSVEPSSSVAKLVLSLDGSQLVFIVGDQEGQVLKVMPAAGGQARELLRLKEPEAIMYNSLAWTPDGRQVLFVRGNLTQEQKTELWRISVDGGEPQKLGLAMKRLRHPSVHPDGRRIAFTAGQSRAEVWVMENFLPEFKDR